MHQARDWRAHHSDFEVNGLEFKILRVVRIKVWGFDGSWVSFQCRVQGLGFRVAVKVLRGLGLAICKT